MNFPITVISKKTSNCTREVTYASKFEPSILKMYPLLF